MALGDEMEPQRSSGTAKRLVIGADRDRPGYYFSIIEFDSYEEAMENSNRPETGEFAERMGELTDGQPTYGNYDVLNPEG